MSDAQLWKCVICLRVDDKDMPASGVCHALGEPVCWVCARGCVQTGHAVTQLYADTAEMERARWEL